MNYYSHNIGDYAQATSHLTLVEDAIYMRLLRRYYAEEAPIIDDLPQVCRWVGARADDEKEAVKTILSEFFVLNNGAWRNKRADHEIGIYQAKAETNRVNGKKGGRPTGKAKETQPVKPGLAKETQQEPTRNPNQEPITNNQETEDQEQSAAVAPPVQDQPPADTSKRGTRLPNDWTLSPKLAAWAKEQRPDLDDRMLKAMADSFRDFWISKPGKNGTKLDWAATWRNWVRNQRIGNQRASPSGTQSNYTDLDKIDHTEGLVRQSDGTYRVAKP